MMLSKALEDLDNRSRMLYSCLCGLRVTEEWGRVMEYVRDEAEAVFDRVTWLEMMVDKGEIPDAEFPGPRESKPESA